MRNLKKVIALVAVFAMMVSTVAFAATFDDVADGDNYYEAIETLNKLGVITGDDENNDGVMSFRPADSITRAEIAVIVARIQGQTGAVAQTNTIFTDVPSTHWASGYIASASNMGIVNGYGDGTFGPDDNVLYEDVIKMLMETLGYKPYAQENGGYPTGYILAAQRQQVLNGVVGGAEGTQATRGQVAQMTNNAIDTPLMERYTYGGTEQYVIWDGESWSPRRTLMSTALGVNKIRGVVVENDITGLDSTGQIDTDVKSTVRVLVEDNYLGSNDTTGEYEIGTTYSFYTGETDANDYLGYDVVLYAVDNNNDTDEIVSITEATGRNTTLDITLDKYDSFEPASGSAKAQLGYMRNDTDRSATKVRIDSDAAIIYNGIAYTSGLENMFGNGVDGDNDNKSKALVNPNSAYSGKITLLDNDDESGYDVVFVDIAASAVVDELTSRGVAMFYNEVGSNDYLNRTTRIAFDSTDTNVKVDITKNGQPYDYTALKTWDVLSVIARTDSAAGGEYYRINVLDETAIVGTVSRSTGSDTSDTGYAYTINGVDYDVAVGAYQCESLRAGSYGTFYVDDNNKIVAYNRSAGGSAATADNYAYVLNTSVTDDGFNTNIPTMQILYKDGSIQTVKFNSTVSVDNPTDAVRAVSTDGTSSDYYQVTVKYSEVSGDANKTAFDKLNDAVSSMAGQVITLSATDGYVRQITLASTPDDDNATLIEMGHNVADTADYDEIDQELDLGSAGNYEIPADALVFFIGKNDSEAAYKQPGNVGTDECSVSTGEALRTNNNFSAVVYTDSAVTEDVRVVVMYNTNAGVGASTGLAYVTGIGRSTVDGSNVLSVDYYQDGEAKTAYTDDVQVGDLTANTVPGSLFKFGMTGDTITSADTYLTFNGTVRDRLTTSSDLTSDGIPNADLSTIRTGEQNGETLTYGAVVRKNGQRLYVATIGAAGIPELSNSYTSVNVGKYGTVNCYLYDPARSGKAKFQLGSVGDINIDKYLTNDNGDTTPGQYTIQLVGSDTAFNAPAWGMLDYVYVREYEDMIDIIDYASWEYDYR